ncbi:MAG: threonylcarbamoyl-AMP synthase [Candidatus Marinimicrobia bacterium]|nr:threonylcarbamoyl-AMP synthase [Candidatus Neomarinimicrobiota bacterium]|tara:strand:+ start:2465 stop:3049 length:585 start_codon:yes stop_codon:yes gene_type:complete
MIYDVNIKHSLKIAADLIKNGEIIIYPTDTIYGFGVDATNEKAVSKLNKLKKRQQVYSIIVDSITMLEKYAQIDSKLKNKIQDYLPGPYTLILKKNKSNLCNLVTLELDTIGIRIPEHFFPCNLVKLINKPIITTSVNLHNTKNLIKIDDFLNFFPEINIFEDSNIVSKMINSTILDCTQSKFNILRHGKGKII